MFSLSIATLILVVITTIPIFRHEGWWVRAFDFPRVQFAIFALILLLTEFLVLTFSDVWSWVLLLTTFSCFACQIWWIFPYTPFFPTEVHRSKCRDAEHSIKVMSANVLTPNRNANALIDLVKSCNPDVLVTLESDAWWEEQLIALEQDYTYTIKYPLDNLYGMHVFSKLPLLNPSIEFLVEDDVPSIHAEIQLRCGKLVRVHFLHPSPPSPTENKTSSERDAELLMVAASVAEATRPVIVTGDLNDVGWSRTTRLFRKVSGLLDPRIGRGMFNTFHANYFFLRWPVDHLFHSAHFSLISLERLPAFGSDHFPLVTELYLDPQKASEQEGIDSSDNDLVQALDKIRSEGKSKSEVPVPGRD